MLSAGISWNPMPVCVDPTGYFFLKLFQVDISENKIK